MPKPKTKKKRVASAYNKLYSKAFKMVQDKYKKKSGQWKKDGFKLAQKAAHKLARQMMKKK
jgi:cation transport regulator ChaB